MCLEIEQIDIGEKESDAPQGIAKLFHSTMVPIYLSASIYVYRPLRIDISLAILTYVDASRTNVGQMNAIENGVFHSFSHSMHLHTNIHNTLSG